MNFKIECKKCGGGTRLVGIEPHHKVDGVDIWTLECIRCGHTDIETPGMPGAGSAMAQDSQQLN